MSNMDQMEDAIHRVALALGITCDEVRRTYESVFNQNQIKQLFDRSQRQIRLISKGQGKSYLSQYAKFDKMRNKKH